MACEASTEQASTGFFAHSDAAEALFLVIFEQYFVNCNAKYSSALPQECQQMFQKTLKQQPETRVTVGGKPTGHYISS